MKSEVGDIFINRKVDIIDMMCSLDHDSGKYVVGGDRGDVEFNDYEYFKDGTIFYDCVLITHLYESEEEALSDGFDAKGEAEYILSEGLHYEC